MSGHVAKWLAPAPFWAGLDGALAQRRFAAPAILRFADDEYMEKLLDLVDQEPARLTEFALRHETWRDHLREPAASPGFRQPRSSLLRGLLRERVAARTRPPVEPAAPASTSAPAVPAPPGAVATPAPARYQLKLYQPSHQRHYLVATSLVCETLGFPDKAVVSAQQEQVGFVLRRLFPKDPQALDPSRKLPPMDPSRLGSSGAGSDWTEHAFVPEPSGGRWVPLDDPARRGDGEELLPLFPLSYTEAGQRQRRLFAGVVPVGRREVYMGGRRVEPDAVTGADSAGAGADDPRQFAFRAQVTEPWKVLLASAAQASKVLNERVDDKGLPDPPKAVATSREQVQTVSWYLLLDFAKLLEKDLPDVWRVIAGQAARDDLPAAGRALVDALRITTLEAPLRLDLLAQRPQARLPAHLADALQAVRASAAVEEGLDGVQVAYRQSAPDALWPDFLFPLADCRRPAPLPFAYKASLPFADAAADGAQVDETLFKAHLQQAQESVESLLRLINAALGENPKPAEQLPAPPLAATPGTDLREGWFLLRCVLERPACCPGCTVSSRPTPPFQLASFFDPDAPARPIRIGLPIDTTPAGLRKFDKNTAIAVSDILCGQIARFKAMTLGDLIRSVLPWPLHKDLELGDMKPCPKDGLQIGMICSLSIPIITICALILLIIMVSLLDLVFRWLPFFFTCFPLPGLKAKEER